MRVLVIGKGGQLAQSLTAAVWPEGSECILRGRPELDLSVPDTIANVVDDVAPDIVINAAAYTAVDKAEQEPEMAHAVNALGAECLAAVCGRRGMPLIHVSSDYVFDGSKPSLYTEEDPVAPLGVYGRSKLEGERRVASACNEYLILRTAWVISPYANNFVKTMLRLAESRKELGVVDDQIGSPTYAPHLADTIVTIVGIIGEHTDQRCWGIYHAAGSGEATWYQLAREVFKQAGWLSNEDFELRAISTAEYPTQAARPANSRLNCNKLAQNFNLRLPAWQDGVQALVDHLRPPVECN